MQLKESSESESLSVMFHSAIPQSLKFSTPEYWVDSLSLLSRLPGDQSSQTGLLNCRQIVCQLICKGSPEKRIFKVSLLVFYFCNLNIRKCLPITGNSLGCTAEINTTYKAIIPQLKKKYQNLAALKTCHFYYFMEFRNFPQRSVKTLPFSARGIGLMPGQRTKIQHTNMWP